ncbi:MAG TPA: endolytic transglycosylase MltG [Leptospiraceae bacterium]|nr:endolytic transglycosylase MltG [Leptospiraceae bacterium]HMY68835.1 endolytic transglycosylase MltG [Leptospiraceae bacterium]HMZ61027.1 endolytic transglycosylase MltG [Leptospiraceae bacterium]HNF12460.1 endolytic transglycosylase MltG [Leptospiraceae bacterium]HNF23993.1 endolytic transglycosylase MltG [Leptospiraceae bacterium]
MKNRGIKIILAGAGAAALLAALVFFTAEHTLGGARGDGSLKTELVIDSGETSKSVIKELHDSGILKSPGYFRFLLRMTGNSGALKQGVYNLDDGMTARKIMSILISGKVKTVTFTVPEGYSNRQIGDLLVSKKLASSRQEFLDAASRKEVLEKYKIPADTSEGYLYPSTYTVPFDYKADKIVSMMIRQFQRNIQSVEGASSLDPKDLHQKIILASIVEREAKRNEERPLMAGVFLKRMKIKMPLESCATVQYLFDKPKSRLLEKDLLIESPYNTYLHKGFPPGPISNPGLPAIQASFKPVESDNLFFLLKGDGYHYFSKSHKEHMEAKKKYIDVLYD